MNDSQEGIHFQLSYSFISLHLITMVSGILSLSLEHNQVEWRNEVLKDYMALMKNNSYGLTYIWLWGFV